MIHRSSRRAVGYPFVLVLVIGNASGFASFAAEPVTVAEVLKGLDDNAARFKARERWWIEFDQTRVLGKLPPGFDPKFPAFRWVNARYDAVELLRKKALPPDEEEVWWLWRDGQTIVYDLAGNYAVYPTKGPEFFQACYYTDTLLLDLHQDAQRVDPAVLKAMGLESIEKHIHRWSLPESLDHGLGYAIEINRDDAVIEGFRCVVLSKGEEDTLWIDGRHGYVCRKRIVRRDGMPVYGVENHDLYEPAPGLWIPRKQQRHFYNGPKTDPSIRGTVRYTEINSLRIAEFENVDLKDFAAPTPRNCTVTDLVRGKTYQVGESAER